MIIHYLLTKLSNPITALIILHFFMSGEMADSAIEMYVNYVQL
jgi:hypothetical protein